LYVKKNNLSTGRNQAGVDIKSHYFQIALDMVEYKKPYWRHQMINNSDDIAEAKIAELTRMIHEFKEKLNIGTNDSEHFMTLNEMERLWSELRGGSDKIYSAMFSSFLNNIDEAELIRKKKLNTGEEGFD
jgi:hypothetical protein